MNHVLDGDLNELIRAYLQFAKERAKAVTTPARARCRSPASSAVPARRNRRNIVVADRTVVLIVEDDQNIVNLVRSNLSARGHDVIVSSDGDRGQRGPPRAGASTWSCWT